jgi:hypothetical protein
MVAHDPYFCVSLDGTTFDARLADLVKYLAPDLETYYREKFEREAKEQE